MGEQELSTDTSQHVRAQLASVIMGMAPLLGKVRIPQRLSTTLDLRPVTCNRL